ncbi:TlpA disulfide reductase family protein [Tenacibaculum sp. 190524A05c]|uniref:TlpA disulfide reductase family protein n=1 Tax=Tenacibaculum platacis TaxID=3137852 RepID=UPI0032B26384
MKLKLIPLTLLLLSSLVSCKQEANKEEQQTPVKKETKVQTDLKKDLGLKVLNFDELKPFIEKNDDKTHVVNFWATWCKPCVEELPAFEKIHEENKDKNVEVLLVSLDFPNEIESHLIPFIMEHKLAPEVIVLDDPDQNKWINGVDKSWSGALPATIIYNKNKRSFYEQSFSYDALNQELQKFIN